MPKSATLANQVADADATGNSCTAHLENAYRSYQCRLAKCSLPHQFRPSYNIGIRGGSDKIQLASSFGYYDQKGIVLVLILERFTFCSTLMLHRLYG